MRRTKRLGRAISLGRNNREPLPAKRRSFWSMRTPVTAAGRYRPAPISRHFLRPRGCNGKRSLRFPSRAAHRRRAAELVVFRGAWFPIAGKLHRSSSTLGCVVGESGHETGAVRCGDHHHLELFRSAAAAREKEMERRNSAGVVGLTLRGAVRAYQLLVSPLLLPSCRFLPSCSVYAAEAIERHGAWRGCILALQRLARCNPWGGNGYDPVPAAGAYNHQRTRAERGGDLPGLSD